MSGMNNKLIGFVVIITTICNIEGYTNKLWPIKKII